MHYCIECDWSMDTDERSTEYERNQRAIQHHLETGHTIVSRLPAVRPRGRADDEPKSQNELAE